MVEKTKGVDPNSSLQESNFPWDFKKTSGKVRDIYNLGDGRLIIRTTDRLSAFDRQVGVISGRGQILNELSAFWFENTADIVSNHMIGIIDPNVMVVRECERIDLEMVVRGYLTGVTDTSIWKRYQEGQRNFGEVTLPDGMRKNQSLLYPILDPTTKASVGHDTANTKQAIIAAGIVTEADYNRIESIALKLFARGEDIARRAGLVLVDTKYEFGRDPKTGEIVLIDEVHTPDSSRFWGFDTYEERMKSGENPDIYDKEFMRMWLNAQGYKGEGQSPEIPEDVAFEFRRRYVFVYEGLTHKKFEVPQGDVDQRINENIRLWVVNSRSNSK